MKRIIASQLLLALLVPCCSSTAFASNVITEGETSQRDIQYQEFSFSKEELEQGRVEACTVTVSQPYSYSTEIPKNNCIQEDPVPKNNKPVQTGDETPIIIYLSMAILSIIGMMELNKKLKK